MPKIAVKKPSPPAGMTALGRAVWLNRWHTNRTQDDFARDTLLSKWLITRIETGRIAKFHPTTIRRLAAGLNISVEDVQDLILPEPRDLTQEEIDAIERWIWAKIKEARGPGHVRDDGSEGWYFADFLRVIYDHAPDAIARMLQAGASAYLVAEE